MKILNNATTEKSADFGVKKITDLKTATRDQNRVNVFVDHKFAFSLTIQQVAEMKVRINNEYTETELEEIQAASDFGKLLQRSLEYALSRPHSEKEIRDYLKRKKIKRELEQKRYDEFLARMKTDEDYREKIRQLKKSVREKNQKIRERDFTEDNRFEFTKQAKTGLPTKPGAMISVADIEAVINKLTDLKIIDDERFARFYVENRNRAKGISEKKLRLELRNKGVLDATIQEVLGENEFGEKARDDKTEIQKIIQKKRRRGYTDDKLKQYLLRQGFSYDLIIDELNQVTDSSDF